MKYTQKSLIFKVLNIVKGNNLIEKNDEIIVALSGGPDSVCLLDILFQIKEKLGFSLSACHFNHKMRGEASDKDEIFVKKLCEEKRIKCSIGFAKTKIKNEEEARDARYSFFEKILGDRRGVKIAIAHNADDLAETFLMRVIRGAGIRGLKSIPLQRKNFIRPLLYISKKQILSHLKDQKLDYCIDQTNIDVDFTRNFIRHKIIPLFVQTNPNFLESIISTVKSIDEDYRFIYKIAEKSLKKIAVETSVDRIVLNKKEFLNLEPSIQNQILFQSIEKINTTKDIGSSHIAQVIEMIKKGEGKKYKALPHSLIIELKSGKIYICKSN